MLENINNDNYLGNTAVVSDLVGQFIYDISKVESPFDVMKTVNSMADIFSGLNEDYTVIPDWNDREHLGKLMAVDFGVPYDSSSTIDLFQNCFAVLALRVFDIIKETHDKSDDVKEKVIVEFKEYVVATLLGVAPTIYGKNNKISQEIQRAAS